MYFLTRAIAIIAVAVSWFYSVDLMEAGEWVSGGLIFTSCTFLFSMLVIEQLSNIRNNNVPF